MTPQAPDWIRLLGIWWLRCEVRAILVAEGEMPLIVGVDGLQASAKQYGLVDAFGQDSVQDVLAAFFERVRTWTLPAGWKKNSLERLWRELNDPHRFGRAAHSTVEAVMHELRTYGIAQLKKPNCQRRLSELSNAQVRKVIERLERLRPKYPAITDELLLVLAELRP